MLIGKSIKFYGKSFSATTYKLICKKLWPANLANFSTILRYEQKNSSTLKSENKKESIKSKRHNMGK